MAGGYLQSRDGVYWSEKLRPVAAINVLGGRTVTLHDSAVSNRTRAAIAHCCEDCGKVIVEIPTLALLQSKNQ